MEQAKDSEYFKSLPPSMLFSERGAEFVVINPGSSNLKIGLASQSSPLEIPHVIAWHDTSAKNDEGIFFGAIGEADMGSNLNLEQRKWVTDTKMSLLNQIEQQLNVPTSNAESIAEDINTDKVKTRTLTADEDSGFQWTQVKTKLKNTDASSTGKASQESNPAAEPGVKEIQGEPSDYRSYICGEEALRIPASEPYVLHRPIRRGHLSASISYPLQRVLSDLEKIWLWSLTEGLSIDPTKIRHLSVVFVAPDTLSTRELKEISDLLLAAIGFKSIVIHQEAVCSVFGNGVTSACVVNFGAHVTSVVCIDEGAMVPTTKIILPFGGQDVSHCLHWILSLNYFGQSRVATCHPLRDPVLARQLDDIKEQDCSCSLQSVPPADVAICERQEGSPTISHHFTLSPADIIVPPNALFLPTLLQPLTDVPQTDARFRCDLEETLESFLNSELARPATESNQPAGNGYRQATGAVPPSCGLGDQSPGWCPLGVHEAIIRSIIAVGRAELQAKMLTNILLVGGGAKMKEIVASLEDRLLKMLPANSSPQSIEVLPSRHNPSHIAWKGGAILAVLDTANTETFVQGEDWGFRNCDPRNPKKYRESLNFEAQLFWYSAALE